MKAMMSNDKCYCTVNKGHNPFNSDGETREKLSYEEGRTAINFNIRKTPIYTADGREVPHLFCLTKDTDNSFVQSRGVGDVFEPIQHHEVFDYIMEEVAPKFPQMELETCGTIYGSSTGLMTFKVGDLFHVSGDKSPSEMRLFVSNPCNGTGKLIMGFTAVRLFCRNQFAAAKREAGRDGFKIVHTKNGVQFLGNAVKEIGEQVAAAVDMKRRMEALAYLKASRADLEKVLDIIYPLGKLQEGTAGHTRMLNLREACVRQFTSGATSQEIEDQNGWKLFNSISYNIFNPERVGSRTDLADIEYQGMAGDKAEKFRRIAAVTERVLAA